MSQEQFEKDVKQAIEQYRWLNTILESDDRKVWRFEANARRKLFRQAMERIVEEHLRVTGPPDIKPLSGGLFD